MILPFQLRPQRLPNKPQEPYIAPAKEPETKKAKAVTIAISIQCQDSIVLCADRLMTHGTANESGSFAHYERKIHADTGRYFAAAIAGAGTTFELRAFSQSFLKRACAEESEDADSLPDIPAILQSELDTLASKLNMAPELNLLVAESTPPSKLRVFRTQGLVIRDARPVEVAGIGDTSLISFLTDNLYRRNSSISDGIVLGILLILAAKTYCPQYCGGQTDACILRTEYPLYDWIATSTISKVEAFLVANQKRSLETLISEAGPILG